MVSGRLGPGASLVVKCPTPLRLDPAGGILTLLDERGWKVHGVAWTRDQCRHPGVTVAFG